MKCAWKELLAVLPEWLRLEVDRLGCQNLQEIRLRLGLPVQLRLKKSEQWLDRIPTKQDLQFVVNMASKYSPWTCSSMRNGFLTAAGGHRIGIFGECIMQDGAMNGIRDAQSLCIRVAKDYERISPTKKELQSSVLIIGPPGSGKTTLLRDVVRKISDDADGSVAVVDERSELFPIGSGFYTGKRTDVLTGCGKPHGIEMALKTMGPRWIAVDEITSREDCVALEQVGWCGVRLLATAHALSLRDLKTRKVYEPLLRNKLFDTVIVLGLDQSWHIERMTP